MSKEQVPIIDIFEPQHLPEAEEKQLLGVLEQAANMNNLAAIKEIEAEKLAKISYIRLRLIVHTAITKGFTQFIASLYLKYRLVCIHANLILVELDSHRSNVLILAVKYMLGTRLADRYLILEPLLSLVNSLPEPVMDEKVYKENINSCLIAVDRFSKDALNYILEKGTDQEAAYLADALTWNFSRQPYQADSCMQVAVNKKYTLFLHASFVKISDEEKRRLLAYFLRHWTDEDAAYLCAQLPVVWIIEDVRGVRSFEELDPIKYYDIFSIFNLIFKYSALKTFSVIFDYISKSTFFGELDLFISVFKKRYLGSFVEFFKLIKLNVENKKLITFLFNKFDDKEKKEHALILLRSPLAESLKDLTGKSPIYWFEFYVDQLLKNKEFGNLSNFLFQVDSRHISLEKLVYIKEKFDQHGIVEVNVKLANIQDKNTDWCAEDDELYPVIVSINVHQLIKNCCVRLFQHNIKDAKVAKKILENIATMFGTVDIQEVAYVKFKEKGGRGLKTVPRDAIAHKLARLGDNIQLLQFFFTQKRDPADEELYSSRPNSTLNCLSLVNELQRNAMHCLAGNTRCDFDFFVLMFSKIDFCARTAIDIEGNTAMHLLVQSDSNLSRVCILLEDDYLLDLRNKKGQTCLDMAVIFNAKEIVKALLEKIYTKYSIRAEHNVFEKKQSPVVTVSSIPTINQILSPADLNSPLHYARSIAMAEILLEKAPKLVEVVNEQGQTPLHIMARGGELAMVEMLIQRGANRNALDKDGCMPLHLAAQAGHIKIVALLIKKSLKTEEKFLYANTPEAACGHTHFSYAICLAAKAGRHKVVKFLLQQFAFGITEIALNDILMMVTEKCSSVLEGDAKHRYEKIFKYLKQKYYALFNKEFRAVPYEPLSQSAVNVGFFAQKQAGDAALVELAAQSEVPVASNVGN